VTNAELQELLKQYPDDMDIGVGILSNKKWHESYEILITGFFGINSLILSGKDIHD
jgi:hypothetical protein